MIAFIFTLKKMSIYSRNRVGVFVAKSQTETINVSFSSSTAAATCFHQALP